MGFIGSQLTAATADGFEFGLWTADRIGDDIRPHGHEDAHVMWAITGAYATEADGETPDGEDTLVYNPPGVYHADRVETLGAMFFSITIKRDLCEARDAFDLPAAPVQIRGGKLRMIMRKMLRECAPAGAGADLEAACLGYELLASLSRTRDVEKDPPKWLPSLCEKLRDGFQATLPDLARDAGVHPSHFIRTFRRHMHCTPGEFARNERLRRAARALADEETPLCDVAAGAGFADQSHMTNDFRRSFGITPAAYRRCVLAGERAPPR